MISFLQSYFGDKIASKPEIKFLPFPLVEGMEAADIKPNAFYFDIRLSELYLRNSVQAGRSFVPRALTITECLYGNGKKLTLPIAVGEHILSEIEELVDVGNKDKAVSFSNCLLAGPMPYRGGDIGLFNGLYRVETGNIADSVFNLVADVTGNLGLNLTNYLDIGRQLAGRLPALLGVDTGDWRIGHYAPIYTPNENTFNRHLVLIGEEGDSFDINSLEVDTDNSRETLRINGSKGPEPFKARDYLLIKLNSNLERNDYTRFGFHQRYEVLKKLLIGRQIERAEWAKTELIQEIAECPDLTEDHQFKLIVMYEMKISQWKQKLGLVKEYKETSYRGAAGTGGVDLCSGAVTSTALNARLPDETVDSLARIQEEWGGLDGMLENKEIDDFSDETVNSFMRFMGEKKIVSGSAADLADAIKIHSMSRH
jgi:hypothetical protein